MRQILEAPVEPKLLEQATLLTEKIYACHEAGQSYDHHLKSLAQLVGFEVTTYQVCSHFGSVEPRSFAHDLLVSSIVIPDDLSRQEMLELLQLILAPKRNELRTSFWLSCLRINTGNARISDIIFWPGVYFKDGNNSRELGAEEILKVAMEDGRTHGPT